MSTENETKTEDTELIPFYEPDAVKLRETKEKELQILAEKAKKLCELDIVDNKTYDLVHKQQMVLREARINIEKWRKSFTEKMQKQVKDAIQIEKDLIAIISETEEDLKTKKEAYDKKIEEEKAEEARKKEEEFNSRVNALAQYGYIHDAFDLRVKSEEDFQALLTERKQIFDDAENARIAQEEKEKKDREEFEKQRVEQEEKAKALQAREDALKAKETEEARKKEIADAEERARRQAIEDARIAQERKEAQERQEQEEKKKQEAEEQKKLEKKKAYKAFLMEYGYKAEDEKDFLIERHTDKIVLYKKLWEFPL